MFVHFAEIEKRFYSINILFFESEAECVYCAIRIGTLNTIQSNFSL
jgi:hypothetical protein